MSENRPDWLVDGAEVVVVRYGNQTEGAFKTRIKKCQLRILPWKVHQIDFATTHKFITNLGHGLGIPKFFLAAAQRLMKL